MGGRINELAGAEVAEQRPRRDCTSEVERDGYAYRSDSEHLEPVTEPPAEVEVREEE